MYLYIFKYKYYDKEEIMPNFLVNFTNGFGNILLNQRPFSETVPHPPNGEIF